MRQQHREFMDPQVKKSQAAAGNRTVRQPRAKLGVLVVDDEHLVRIMVQLGLEREGFDVWLAANGREAIAVYRAHKEDIAVVLLDVHMPGLDGPATLDALRKRNPEVRACFMSGDTGSYEPDELLQRGAVHVLAKPFRLDDLANILRQLADDVPADLLSSDKVSSGEPEKTMIQGGLDANDPCCR
jgi:CheY-like chemotaxis protein